MVRGTDLKILGLVGSDAGVYQCLESCLPYIFIVSVKFCTFSPLDGARYGLEDPGPGGERCWCVPVPKILLTLVSVKFCTFSPLDGARYGPEDPGPGGE
jgi:hypothetical protein